MTRRARTALLPVVALAAAALAAPASTPAARAATPAIGHVWTIVLENSEFAQTFIGGRASAPYLTQTLPSQGRLVTQYYGTGHSSLDNYIAMTSGQGPNPSTQGDCDDRRRSAGRPASGTRMPTGRPSTTAARARSAAPTRPV